MTTLNTTARRDVAAALAAAERDLGPAEALFLAGFVLGAAMWLAWARYCRWV